MADFYYGNGFTFHFKDNIFIRMACDHSRINIFGDRFVYCTTFDKCLQNTKNSGAKIPRL